MPDSKNPDRRTRQGRRHDDIAKASEIRDIKMILADIDSLQERMQTQLDSIENGLEEHVKVALQNAFADYVGKAVQTIIMIAAMIPPWWAIYKVYEAGYIDLWLKFIGL